MTVEVIFFVYMVICYYSVMCLEIIMATKYISWICAV